MSEFKIEKGIPLPPRRSTHAARDKYGFTRMEVGDSIFFADAKPSAIRNVAYTASKDGARMGRKFATRTVEGGVRVWRVK